MDKSKLSTKNTFLEEWSKKESSISPGFLTPSGDSKVSGVKGLVGLKQELLLSSQDKSCTSQTLLSSASLLMSSNLNSSLMSKSHLQSNLVGNFSARPNVSQSASKLLTSSSLLTSTKDAKSSGQLTTDLSQGLNISSISTFSKTPLIESSLTKLSLTQTGVDNNVTKKMKLGHAQTSTEGAMHELKQSLLNPPIVRAERGAPTKRHRDTLEKTVKKKRLPGAPDSAANQQVQEYVIEPPDYTVKLDKLEETGMEKDLRHQFNRPVEMKADVVGLGRTLIEINALKRGFVNCVSGSLISQPDFKNPGDPTRQQLTEQVFAVAKCDPEFVLKAALYCRRELNIRTTTNFLLALSANEDSCRNFLKRYYCVSVMLPSDWIEVAEIFQTLENTHVKAGSLPAALRKAMASHFPYFDKYQLAKYNKESSGKKKKSKSGKNESKEKKLPDKKSGSVAKKGKSFFDSDSSNTDDEATTIKELPDVSYDEKESEEKVRKQRFTLKFLIRKLHLREPEEHVMSIIGKKYPMTFQEFNTCRLQGTWDPEKAGKRMKLPVPETWETQVSLKGNKATTWQDLIDHKKLPFMAMLRNLRNLIKAGISPRHHNFVLKRLTDKRSVVNSKQFPFRFFSAYVVLGELEENYEKNQREIIEAAEMAAMQAGVMPSGSQSGKGHRCGVAAGRVQDRGGKMAKLLRGAGRRGRGGPQRGGVNAGRGTAQRGGVKAARGRAQRGGANAARGDQSNGANAGQAGDPFPWWVLKKMKKDSKEGIKEVPYDKALIQRYRTALDTAVKIATVHNVQPIKGRTLLLCETGSSLDKPCTSARGLGKPRTVKEMIVLMGLMCKYSCEECDMIVFDEQGFTLVKDLHKGTILDNMETVLNMTIPENAEEMDSCGVPFSPLFEKLRDRKQVDNLLVFGEDFYPSSRRGRVICDWLQSYRHLVNPNLLFVSVTFSAPKPGFAMNVQPEHHNDIYISGYSDSILRFIAERGADNQVTHIDKIDLAFKLPLASATGQQRPGVRISSPEPCLQLTSSIPQWRTVRVFISSTFKDMHGERDMLTRFIFPELRSLLHSHCVNIHEVDLRWGVTEEDTKNTSTLEVCLQEVTRCQLFIGLLGERYGWIPQPSQVPNIPELAWVHDYTPSSSVTELEMHLGALSRVGQVKEWAFFFFRDSNFLKDIPKVFEEDFKSESELHKTKITNLKKRIRNSGLEVYDGYPCRWAGCVDGRPMVAGLEEFGARVLNTLVNAVNKLCPKQSEFLSEDQHISNLQWAFISSCSQEFIGRKSLVTQILSKINSTTSGTIGVVGKSGSGKTALMATTITQYVKSKQAGGSYSVFVNMTGSAPGTTSLPATLRRLANEINTRFRLGYTLPEEYNVLIVKFKSLLEDTAEVCPSKLVVFLDGVDQMDRASDPFSLEWLPQPLPANVIFVITATEGEKTHLSLKRIGAHEVSVAELDMWDKAELVRQTLARHSKSLDESGFGNQMRLLMLKKDASNPLYLKLACEELRVFGVFEKVAEKLKSLPHTTAQMLQEVLNRLEQDHGRELVCVGLSLLACARQGLYPEELLELISWHLQLGGCTFEPRDLTNLQLRTLIPPLKFMFLAKSFKCFLNPSTTWSSLLHLSNREICQAVKLRYLKGTDSSQELRLHKLLAGFFLKEADYHQDNTFQGTNPRAFCELPYHLAAGGNFVELEQVLCNHQFIQSKCSLGLAASLLEDFNPALIIKSKVAEKEFTRFQSSTRVQQFKSFLSRNIEILVNYPALEWQQAINEPKSTAPHQEALSARGNKKTTPNYMEWCNRPESASQCYMTLSNFKLPINCLDISPDNTKLVAGSADFLVRVFDMVTGKELHFFIGHSDLIADVCFVGVKMICSASADTSLSVWDVEQKHRIHTLNGHNRRVNTCTSDCKGKLIASGGWDSTVCIWQAEKGEQLCEFDVGSPVNCVDFHPVEEQVVIGSWDAVIRIYNYFHKTRIAVIRGHSSSVRDIAFSLDGRHLASAAMDGDIIKWAADRGSQVGNIRGHSGPVNKLTFCPSGRELITAGEDHQIKVWSGDLGFPVHQLQSKNLGAATSVSISPSGSAVAVGYHLGQVQVFDIISGVKLAKIKVSDTSVRALAYSSDGSYIYAGCDDGQLQVLESNQGSRVCTLLGHSRPILCVDTVKTYIATGGEDFLCCLYEDISQLKKSKISAPRTILKGHTAPVTACTFSADGSMLATASRDTSVRIYNLRDVFISVTPEPNHILHDCHADWINSCRWSNTGNFLVTASNDFNLKLWDTSKRTEKIQMTGHSSSVNTVAYKYGCIVSGSSDGQVKVWSHKGTLITTLPGHTLRVNACDLYVKVKAEDIASHSEDQGQSWADMEVDNEPDKKQTAVSRRDVSMQDVIVASAGDDGDVWIWKPLQAKMKACLSGHSNRVLAVAADAHSHIASSSLDNSIRFWKVNLQEQDDPAGQHSAPVTFVSVASNMSLVISGSRDGILQVWCCSEDEDMYRVKHSFQAHEKSVNCGSFDKGNSFVTGGDDNYLHTWEVLTRKQGFFIRKSSSLKTKIPVSSITLDPSSGWLYFTTWDGVVSIAGGTSRFQAVHALMNVNQTSSQPAKDWPTASTLCPDSGQLLVGTTASSVCRLTLNPNKKSLESVAHIQVTSPDAQSAAETGKPTVLWVNCIAVYKDVVLAGDSSGQVVISNNECKVIQKVHTSAVTCIQVVKGVVFTGSSDCCIKVWNLAGLPVLQLKQVGQFFCPSKVTTLLAMPGAFEEKRIHLLAGDQLGNILQLCWHS